MMWQCLSYVADSFFFFWFVSYMFFVRLLWFEGDVFYVSCLIIFVNHRRDNCQWLASLVAAKLTCLHISFFFSSFCLFVNREDVKEEILAIPNPIFMHQLAILNNWKLDVLIAYTNCILTRMTKWCYFLTKQYHSFYCQKVTMITHQSIIFHYKNIWYILDIHTFRSSIWPFAYTKSHSIEQNWQKCGLVASCHVKSWGKPGDAVAMGQTN